jgi:hypothetical protein
MGSFPENCRVVLLLAASLVLLCGCQSVREEARDSSTHQTVRLLGTDLDKRDEAIVSLSHVSRDAIPLLIAELHTIPETIILPANHDQHRDALHIVWCLRALRYLTHRDFTAKSTHVFRARSNRQTVVRHCVPQTVSIAAHSAALQSALSLGSPLRRRVGAVVNS